MAVQGFFEKGFCLERVRSLLLIETFLVGSAS